MKTLLVLVGVQGAGKTTVLKGIVNALVLKPSTQRSPRFAGENEYHFETVWNSGDFAWTIQRGLHNYGMRCSELDRIDHVGITVFDPSNLQVLLSSSVPCQFEVITIGLDTITDLAEQHVRVAKDPARQIDQSTFDQQKNVVQGCDVVLSGGEKNVIAAVNEIAKVLGGRGGVLSGETIKCLIEAGTLLENVDRQRIEVASYDLRLFDKYWCQGKYHELTASSQTMIIPAYSFVLVTAVEQAIMPRFLVGTFDVRVKLFISGVSLSNGPQVDPGYRGALLCMLYNASGTPVYLNRGEHFATLQFQTTSTNSKGYTAHYQGKKTFEGFVDARTANDPGGRIREDLDNVAENLKKEIKDFKNFWWVVMAVVIAMVVFLIQYSFSVVDKASQAVEKSAELTAKGEAVFERIEKELAKSGGALSVSGNAGVKSEAKK